MMRTEAVYHLCVGTMLALLWGAGLAAAIAHINVGLDISDTGFYLLNYDQPKDIYSQSTLFGVVWGVISRKRHAAPLVRRMR